jgi:outer membrane protein OmpA-like peptidoglycan-associated protein
MTFNRSFIIAAGLCTVLVIPAAAAERQTLTFRGGASIEPKALTDFLFPEAQCENVKYQCMSVRPSVDRSVGVEVRFPTGSAELTPAARTQLEPIGKVLAGRNGKLNPGEIVIEGHTDARGSAELNRKLSEQRANAVVTHLVSTYKVEPTALKAVGRGKEQLREGSRPDSEVNRRVELVRKAN